MSPLFPAERFDLVGASFEGAKLVVLYRFSRRKNADQQVK